MSGDLEFAEFANTNETDGILSPDAFGEKTCDEIHSVELTHPGRMPSQERVMHDLEIYVLGLATYTYRDLGGVYKHLDGTTYRVEDGRNSILFDVWFHAGHLVVYPHYSPPAEALQDFIDDVGIMWGL